MSATDAATRGAALLDRERPGWAYGVDLARLNMAQCTECVLGQLYGEYQAGLGWVREADERPYWFGFDLDRFPAEGYVRLAEAWAREVCRRLLFDADAHHLVERDPADVPSAAPPSQWVRELRDH